MFGARLPLRAEGVVHSHPGPPPKSNPNSWFLQTRPPPPPPPFQVPPGHVWLQGDNAAVSKDSRMYGAVPRALVKGKLLCQVMHIGVPELGRPGALRGAGRGASFALTSKPVS